MKRVRVLLALLLALAGQQTRAQFYLNGEDPGGLRWRSIETPTYRFIYPEGIDSLAREYARIMEMTAPAVGRSAGVRPGGWQWGGKTAVILHNQLAVSNATVVWAPKRLEIYTNPQAYEADPFPWITNLALHEQRHICQMQMGYKGVHRVLSYILGEMWPGACAGIYARNTWLEGDAVIAETALSRSGRGRTADFLNYYMMSFDQGKWRKLGAWRAGSERFDFPDHYALGYLFYSGVRAFYGEPMVSAKFIELAGKRPFGLISNKRGTIRDITGKTPGKIFPDIARKTYDIWAENARVRAPYTPSDTLTGPHWFDTDYHHPLILEDGVYVTKHDKSRTSALIRIDSTGRERFIGFSASSASCLHPSHDGKRIWWSETVSDARWTLASYSIIRYRDIIRKDEATAKNGPLMLEGEPAAAFGRLKLGPARDLTRKTRYYNPCPSHDGQHLAATEHLTDGRTAIVILSTEDGSVCQRIMAPDSLQVVDATWLEDQLFASGISPLGFGIYRVDRETGLDSKAPEEGSGAKASGSMEAASARWTCLLAPQPVKIHHLDGDEGMLRFSSDRNGSDEWYEFDPVSLKLWQLTSLRYGGEGFEESPYDGRAYYSLNTLRGQMLASTPIDSLMHREVSFADIYHYPVADSLSKQEAMLARAEAELAKQEAESAKRETETERTDTASDRPETSEGAAELSISEPRHYSKFGNLFHFHSWAPFYANVDNIKEMSYDYYYDLVGLGVSGFSQNELGTATLTGGYCAHKDPYSRKYWRHSGHLQFTYTGWYPVIECKIDFNDQAARMTTEDIYTANGEIGYYAPRSRASKLPFLRASLSVYIPLRFTRSGWTYGFIPRLNYSVSNDALSPHRDIYWVELDGTAVFMHRDENYFQVVSPRANQTLSMTLRAYASMGTAESAYYPRWGAGLEVGGAFPFWYPLCNPVGYAYLYGYTPGFFSSHGLKLTAKYQQQFRHKKTFFYTSMTSTLPRGFADSEILSNYYTYFSEKSVRVSAEYAMPFYIGDPCWGDFLSIRRMVLTPHFDYTRMNGYEKKWEAYDGELWSVGASLAFDFRSLFWMGIQPTLGVTFSYNGGAMARYWREQGADIPRFYVAPVISFAF